MHELRPVCQTLITCPWQVESLRGSYAGRYNKDNTAITTYLCWLCHQTKKIILFVCLSWHSYLLRCGCSLSLPIPHGMHLVVPTHPCFFWAVCHPNRTFSPKSLSKNPRPPNHALLPLTHDLTTSCIGWVHAGDVWALRMLQSYVCPKSVCCSCVCHGLQARLHSLPFIFDFLWRELFFDVSFFDGLLPLGVGPCLIVGFYFFSPFFCSVLQSCCHFLL